MKSKRMQILSNRIRNNSNNNINNTISTINNYKNNSTLTSFLSDSKDYSILTEQTFTENFNESISNKSISTDTTIKEREFGLKEIIDDLSKYENVEENKKQLVKDLLLRKVKEYQSIYLQNEKKIQQIKKRDALEELNTKKYFILLSNTYREKKLKTKLLLGFKQVKHQNKLINFIKFKETIKKKRKCFDLLLLNHKIILLQNKRNKTLANKALLYLINNVVLKKITHYILKKILDNIKKKTITTILRNIINKNNQYILNKFINSFTLWSNWKIEYTNKLLSYKQFFVEIEKEIKMNHIKKYKIPRYNKKREDIIHFFYIIKQKSYISRKYYTLTLLFRKYLLTLNNPFVFALKNNIKKCKFKQFQKNINHNIYGRYIFNNLRLSSIIIEERQFKQLSSSFYCQITELKQESSILMKKNKELIIDFNKLGYQIEANKVLCEEISKQNNEIDNELQKEKEKYQIIFNNNIAEIENLSKMINMN